MGIKQDDYLISKEIDKGGNTVTFKHKSRIYAKQIQLQRRHGSRSLKMDIYTKANGSTIPKVR